MVIGLTGYYCSGKSTVEKIINEEYDFYSIDMDKLGHSTLHMCKESLVAAFGSAIIAADGSIDRKKLGAIVFSNSDDLGKLNSIVHPVMKSETLRLIHENSARQIILDGALLFDVGLDAYCDAMLVVRCSLWNVFLRGRKRDGHTIKRIITILKNQKLKQYLNKRRKNDDIYYIHNNGNLAHLRKSIIKTLRKLGVLHV